MSQQPIRTCVGCRQRERQASLARVTTRAGVLVADGERRAPGRGAYLHRRRACLDAFARKGGFVRSLGCVVARAEREALRAKFPEVHG